MRQLLRHKLPDGGPGAAVRPIFDIFPGREAVTARVAGWKPSAPSPRTRLRQAYVAACVALLGLFALQIGLHATRMSATTDESFHLYAGYRYWQCGDFGVNPEHPPLLKLVAALPLRLGGVVEPQGPCGAKLTQKLDGFKEGIEFTGQNGGDGFLVPARLAAAGFSLLLAALVFFAAREMFGNAEALVALALLAFEPNLIAHGSLITTDMALTATMFASVYALYRYRSRPGRARLLLAGLAVGLMLASKHSAVYVLPILVLLVCAEAVLARLKRGAGAGVFERELPRGLAALALTFVLGLVMLWAAYGFRHSALPAEAGAHLSAVEYLQQGPRPETAKSVSGVVLGLIDRIHVLPASYTIGLADVIAGGDRITFLLGKRYPSGQWFYFPVAFSIKSSLALLLLLLLFPVGLLARRLYRERPRELLFMLAPALAFMALATTWRINIGVRHALPVYPFLVVLAAAGACALARRHRVALGALVVLLCYHGAVAAQTSPNYLAFSNALWGGTENTYRVLHDSNVEWEQNLLLLDEYMKREGVTDCLVSNFGGAELVRRQRTCRVVYGVNGTIPEREVKTVPEVYEGAIVISTSALPPLGGPEYAQFVDMRPDALIGGSLLVFRGRFDIRVAAALNRAARAAQLSQQKRLDEAIATAREAVAMAPEDPRTHVVLGATLARAVEQAEAGRELDIALRLAQADTDAYPTVLQAIRNVRVQYMP
ncbi:MAG TPA: glycosyltransferase family 39 protein [Pyrinomonadaceae bacterium]